MPGVLLAVAFGAVLRIQRLDAVLLDGAAARTLLLVGGLLSLLVAAVLVVSGTSSGCSTTRAFLAGAVTLLGLPPSGLFLTEAALVVAGLRSGYGWAMAIVLVLLRVVFVGTGVCCHAHDPRSAAGACRAAGTASVVAGEALSAPLTPIALALAAACLLALATPLAGTLDSVVAVLGGVP